MPPFDLQFWAGIAAMVSAMVDVLTLGKSYGEAYSHHSRTLRTQQQAGRLRIVFSTFSPDEIKAIEERLKRCRDRFISEGAGAQRKQCLCSVLADVREGNGGFIPLEEWEQAYQQLRCRKRK